MKCQYSEVTENNVVYAPQNFSAAMVVPLKVKGGIIFISNIIE
jgi:hypothetical protein